MTRAMIFKAAVLALAGASLSGCAYSYPHLSSDFGALVRQDEVAQIADPEAHYKGDPAPGSNGARVGLAQERYRTGKVIPPSPIGTSMRPKTALAPRAPHSR